MSALGIARGSWLLTNLPRALSQGGGITPVQRDRASPRVLTLGHARAEIDVDLRLLGK